ncbi:MAG: hypothetical protein KKB31_00775 [Nanoarchaeota archaeon]|nr:hypothetical protein [Nanoarchaeota archaeon]
MKVRNGRKTLWVKIETWKTLKRKQLEGGFDTMDQLINHLIGKVKK